MPKQKLELTCKGYGQISQYALATQGMFTEESYMQLGERKQPITSFKQAFD